MIEDFAAIPALPGEKLPSDALIAFLKENSAAARVTESPGIRIDNRYYKDRIAGAKTEIFLRAAVYAKLQEASALLQPDYGLVIFDGYRSRETQAGLFGSFFEVIRSRHPGWSDAELQRETRKFIAHPNEPSRFDVPPHNSGGAVDLSLSYRGDLVDMGTDFDDLTEIAATAFFEQPYSSKSKFTETAWASIRRNRRILTAALRHVGFTNWPHEWWHFDLGDAPWARETGKPSVYDSMAPLV